MDDFNTRLQDRTIRHAVYLEGLKTREAKRIVAYIDKEIIPELIDQLTLRLARIEEFGYDRGVQTTRRLEEMINGFKTITNKFKDINSRLQGDFFELIDNEIKWNVGTIIDEAGFALDLTLPAIEQIQGAILNRPFDGRTLEKWFERLADNVQENLEKTIRAGVVEGKTTSQIVRSVRGTRKLQYRDGILGLNRRQTEAVVRSAIAHIANATRQEVFDANPDLIKRVQWIATLDTRTCLQCAPLDNKIFPRDKGVRPPLHVNCRCIIVAVLESDNSAEGKRASMNGQVPADITYNQWLKKQSFETQKMALGRTRAELFRKGDLDISQFTTNSRHQLTLEELRKLEPKAFDKVELAKK